MMLILLMLILINLFLLKPSLPFFQWHLALMESC